MKIGVNMDCLLRQVERGSWVLTNPKMKTHFKMTPELAKLLLDSQAGMTEEQWLSSLENKSSFDLSEFAHSKGLMDDPTGCAKEPSGKPLSGKALYDAFKRKFVLIHEGDLKYRDYFNLKTSSMDSSHLGSFHQVLGHHQLFVLRMKENWKWWHDQKFSPDGLSVKPGLYKFVQEYFLKNYFNSAAGPNLTGKTLLDFACGNGLYANLFTSLGAKVTGVDTSPWLIDLAKRNFGKNVSFIQPDGIAACDEYMNNIPAQSFDYIYLSDALLFFFYDPKTGKKNTTSLTSLLRNFNRILKPNGKFLLMEPNSTFWLNSWFEGEFEPYAVVTESKRKVYQVAPSAEEVIAELGKADLYVESFVHPNVDPVSEDLDPKLFGYAKNFPLWDFYVAAKR